MNQLTVNLFDKNNQKVASEILYNTSKSIKSVQDALKKDGQFYKDVYSSTDQVIGKKVPTNTLKDTKKNKIQIYPSAFGTGIEIDQDGKVSSVTYNEAGQILRIGEALNSTPRYTNYSYIYSNYNHFDLDNQKATRSTLVYRKDPRTNRAMGREEVYNHQNKLLAVIDFNNLTDPIQRVSDSHKKTTYTYDERLRTKIITRPNGKNLEHVYYPAIATDTAEDVHESSFKLKLIKDPEEDIILRAYRDYNVFGKPNEIDEYNYHDIDGDGNWDKSTLVTIEREYSDYVNVSVSDYGKIVEEKTSIFQNTSSDITYVEQFNKKINHSYHASGPRKRLTYPDGDFNTYTYNGGQIGTVYFGESGDSDAEARQQLDIDYKDAKGKLDLRAPAAYRFGDEKNYITFNYKNNDRRFGIVESIGLKVEDEAETYSMASYSYDNLKKKLSKKQWGNIDLTFAYDSFNRLKQSASNNSNYTGTDIYSLDLFDNFLGGGSSKVYDSTLSVTQLGYNRYSSFTPSSSLKTLTAAPQELLSAVNTQQIFDYDESGNLTKDSNFEYDWDNFQRLSSAKAFRLNANVPETAHHAYDAAGRRVHTFYTDLSDVTMNSGDWKPVFYTYDGSKMIEKSFNSSSYASRYFYENSLSPYAVQNEVFGFNNEILFLARDENGSVTGVFNGEIYEHYYYSSTGLMTCFNEDDELIRRPVEQDFGWGGMFIDPFTGLYHTHYREFDPVTNRWLTEDPSGMVDGFNLYGNYFGVNSADPDGREAVTIAIIALTAVAGVVLDNYFHHPLDGKFNWGASALKNGAIASAGGVAGHFFKSSRLLAFGVEAAVDMGASTAYDTMIHGDDLGTSALKNTIFAGVNISLNLGFAKKFSHVARPGRGRIGASGNAGGGLGGYSRKELLDLADEMGIDIPNDVNIMVRPGSVMDDFVGDGINATFGEIRLIESDKWYRWDDLFPDIDSSGTNIINLSIRESSDLSTGIGRLAHELHELKAVRRQFNKRNVVDLEGQKLLDIVDTSPLEGVGGWAHQEAFRLERQYRKRAQTLLRQRGQ
ncbi:MAG: hypothetical protein NE330_08575 [Lentisphaeraceae bacterium]|nr:hypothetical protein [Lentisphaeraceae bacterium]